MTLDARIFDPKANERFKLGRTGLGASDAGTVLGISRFSTTQELYDQLVAVVDFSTVLQTEMSPDQQRGLVLEDTAAEMYEQVAGRMTNRTAATIDVDRDWLAVTPDRFAPYANRDGVELPASLVEIKCVRQWSLERILAAGEAEPSHIAQCQLQMHVTGIHHCDLFYWNAESMKTLIVPLEYDAEAAGAILTAMDIFWHQTFEPRRRPFEGAPSEEDIDLSEAMVALEDPVLEATIALYKGAKKDTKEKLKARILELAGADKRTKVRCGGFSLGMSRVVRKVLDEGGLDLFLVEHDRRLDEFKSVKSHRALRVTGKPSEEIAALSAAQLQQLADASEELK